LPPQSVLHLSQHVLPHALQQHVALLAHDLPQLPNQSYIDCVAFFSCPPAIAAVVPTTKNANKANITIFLTIVTPFHSADYTTKYTKRQLKDKIMVAKAGLLGYNIGKITEVGVIDKLIFLVILGICINTGALAMNDQIVVLETSQGNIEIKLMPDIAPKTCENFVKLVEKGYYNGLIFHRCIKDFMIQGGDPTGTGRGGSSIWGKPFADEFNVKVKFDSPGILAMANSGPNTNGSQFFITTTETPHLNMRHTIFGKVISGYDVVQKIENARTGPGDKPVSDQKIIKAYLKK